MALRDLAAMMAFLPCPARLGEDASPANVLVGLRIAKRRGQQRLQSLQDPLHYRANKGIEIDKTRGKKEHHLWKRKTISGSVMKARHLVNLVIPTSNVKEEIYGALDEWVAFEEEFPLVAIKEAIKYLKKQGQWQRIIQVSKWMLSKGQGMTFSTYDNMLKAYEMDSRLEEAKALWQKLVTKYTRSVPRTMFGRMIIMYDRQGMPKNALEVYAQMQEVEVKPDEGTIRKIVQIYQKLEMIENIEKLACKYPEIRKYCHSVAKD